MNAAVGLMDGLGLDGDRCIRVIPRQFTDCIYPEEYWMRNYVQVDVILK